MRISDWSADVCSSDLSHDLAIFRQIATHVMVMYLGCLMEDAPAPALFGRQYHPYTQALLSAVPVPDPDIEQTRRHLLLKDDVPSPLDPPSGCVFRTRCPVAKPNCILDVPAVPEAADADRKGVGRGKSVSGRVEP